MQSKIIKFILITILALLVCQGEVRAQNLKASLAILPGHSELDKDGNLSGGFVELVNAIDDIYTRGNISIELYPFARSLMNVQTGIADFHLPIIKRPNFSLDTLPFAYASECINQVSFVLYTRADRPSLDQKNIKQYVIETLRGHQLFFPFKIIETNSIEQGIKKLLRERTDGYIMQQSAVDTYIRKHKIKNIRRTLYGEWDSCVVISKGPKQKKIDNIISTALRELKKNGRIQTISKNIYQPFVDWQPYDMEW